MRLLRKYENMSTQVRAAFWYTICNFFQKGISFIIVPIYIRLLNTGEYGEWSVFQSWRDILIIFASLNLYCGVFTKTLVDIKNDRNRYTSSMQGLGSVITIVMFIIYLVFHSKINKILGLDIPIMLFLFMYFLVYPAFQFWSTRQRVEYRYKMMVFITIVISIFTPVLSIFLLINSNLRVKAVIYGYLIIQCVIGLYFYILQFIKGKVFFDKDYWKYALRFNIPLIPHYLSLIVLGQADRIMIKRICGKSDAGIYSFAYQIATAISVLISAINGSRVPWTYEQLRDRTYSQLKQISNILCVFMAIITIFIALLSPEIVRVFGTEDYMSAVYVIPIVSLGVYFTFVYDLFCGVEFYYGATKYVMIASCIGAMLNIILNTIFIPIYGLMAAAYTTLACYFVFMLMHFIFMKRICKAQKITENVYDIKGICVISGIAMIISFISMFTYYNDLVRYMSLIFFVGLIILGKSSFINGIKGMKNEKKR